jgi:tetratricopeptide (TPR) repeat protein
MIRRLIVVLIIGLARCPAYAQQVEISLQLSPHGTQRGFPDKAELLRLISLNEIAIQRTEAADADSADRVEIYLRLGRMYEDAGMYLKSEDALQRAVSLLGTAPQDRLAEAIGQLAGVHDLMGKLREAKREQLEALRMREHVGDPLGTARTWNDLADLYFKQQRYKTAANYAQRAMDVLGNRSEVAPEDRIRVRQSLALALCRIRKCASAIPLLQDALELAKRHSGDDSLAVGVGYYLLGFASWQNGNRSDAAEWMQRGTMRMKVDLGWGQAIYVNAMRQYARFLREQGQLEAAMTAEREVKLAEAVVDARSITGRTGEVGAAVLR